MEFVVIPVPVLHSPSSPEAPLVEDEGVFKVAKMIESVCLDMKGQRVLGVVVQDGVDILQSL